jgi:invasion protein IalB
MSRILKFSIFLLVLALLPINTSNAAQKFTRSKVFGDWILQCSKNADPKSKAKERCNLQQRLLNKQGQVMMQVVVGRIGNQKYTSGVFTLPLGFSITKGVSISVDKNKPRNLVIKTCLQGGCIADIKITRKLRKELNAGRMMKVAMTVRGQKKLVELPISLKGITNGIKGIR